jgi:hypothetical protein
MVKEWTSIAGQLLANARLLRETRIPVATRNRPLLDNGSVNMHSRGNGYADYIRRTVQGSVLFTVRIGL